ncbi:hypothetical protein OTU49_012592 [Cherax quadricarinatus]|uniref:DDE-1 domain-containing protein n=1 Tax=Cherax quadricarinatus TaxID=27406 RepID=A0AAW0VXM8_CHEQU
MIFECEFRKIVNDGGYTPPQQIFSVDETGLYWKRLPSRTNIRGNEETTPGLKASKDRLELLLGGNAVEDLKLKPMLVYHLKTPWAIKKFEPNFPMIWLANKIARITKSIFKHRFSTYFCPTVEKYCTEKNLPHKALLDNATCHPSTLRKISKHIKVVSLDNHIIHSTNGTRCY